MNKASAYTRAARYLPTPAMQAFVNINLLIGRRGLPSSRGTSFPTLPLRQRGAYTLGIRYLSQSRRLHETPSGANQEKGIRVNETKQVTKATLLAQANSRLSKLWINIKWPLVRDNKTSKLDISSAFISGMIMGNLLWIILGTTTFGLMVMYSLHYLDNIVGSDKEKTPRHSIFGYISGSILSHGLGVNLQFEKGSLPEFKDGKLKLKNVTITSKDDAEYKVNAKAESMNVTLSFNKWYEGNGLVYDLELYGLNAKVSKDTEPKQASKKYFNVDKDYLLEHVKIYDSLIEVVDANDGEPMRINIFNCDLPKVRGDQLVLDFFNANNASGAINNSLFTIHKRQSLDLQSNPDDKLIRFKLDAIDLGNIARANSRSKFNWIVNGKAEVIADITLPKDKESEQSVGEAIGKLFKNISSMNAYTENGQEESLLKDAISAIYHTFKKEPEEVTNESYVMVNVKVKLWDLQASLPHNLPMSANSTPYVSLSDLRSLIGFVNQEKSPITLKTTIIEKTSELQDIEHLGQTKMFDSIIADMYDDLMSMVKDDEKRIISTKTWASAIATQLLILGLGALA
ncbi:Mitochondrial distribution and morphology protein 32 [Candida parapsilosis]|nr:Mitochondrial distribution and morphology protein 32 [Candida parapsilosis]